MMIIRLIQIIFIIINFKIIYSESETLIEDSENNFIFLKNGFEFDINNEIIRSNKSTIVDKNNNKYILKIYYWI